MVGGGSRFGGKEYNTTLTKPNPRFPSQFPHATDSEWLGKAPWEVPIGRTIFGMDTVIDKLYEVGEIHPFDKQGVKQGKIWEEGNEYLHREFPKLDYFTDCAVIGPTPEQLQQRKAQEEEEKEAGAAAVVAASGADKATGAAAAAQAAEGKDGATSAAAGGKGAAAEDKAAKASASGGSKLAAAVEEQVTAAGQRPESALWGAGTVFLILGSISVFVVLLYRLGDETAAVKGR